MMVVGFQMRIPTTRVAADYRWATLAEIAFFVRPYAGLTSAVLAVARILRPGGMQRVQEIHSDHAVTAFCGCSDLLFV